MGLTTILSGVCRDNPGREVTLTIQRGLDTKPFPLPVTPDLALRDNGGVIGVKLGANAKVFPWLFESIRRCSFDSSVATVRALQQQRHVLPRQRHVWCRALC